MWWLNWLLHNADPCGGVFAGAEGLICPAGSYAGVDRENIYLTALQAFGHLTVHHSSGIIWNTSHGHFCASLCCTELGLEIIYIFLYP